MARQKKAKGEAYFKAFPKNLRDIMKEKGTTQQELAEYLGFARQTVSVYCDGSSSPDWETLAKIAQFFDVSVDWLLGLSSVKTADATVKAACEVTGLSENAVKTLQCYSGYSLNPILVGYMDSIDLNNIDWFGAARVHACTNKLLECEYERVFSKDPNKPKIPNLLAALYSYIFDTKAAKISAHGKNMEYISSVQYLGIEQQGRPIEPIFVEKMLNAVCYHELLDCISQLKSITVDTEKAGEDDL